ncbi:MAG: BCCT family transporter [Myxococcales bacterium]|nr:BCCT family transporter [Myxococcales bacterium]
MTARPTRPTAGGGNLVANRFVFAGSILLVAAFVAAAGAASRRAESFFGDLLSLIARNFGWFYIVSVGVLAGFSLWLAGTRHGAVRLGKDHERPEFHTLSWLAMLFSAGMGIGLLFFGVAEPIMHFTAPPEAEARSVQAARDAMLLTFFHWGLHAWGVYVVVGLALAYFHFRHDLPMSLRSCLHPVLGERIWGRAGDLIDLLSVFATIFGLATSLGLGAMQINAGLSHVFGVPSGANVQLVIIAVITLCATASVVSGLHAGIRRLSELNMLLAGLLLGFVLLAGPTLFLLDAFVDNIGYYLRSVVHRTFMRDAYRNNDWLASWTIFYWAWWIAWSPFVGTFIARISRGRTVREFVLGVLLVPTLLTFVWLTVFGNTALHMQLLDGKPIAGAVEANSATAIYAMLAELPASAATAPLTVVLVALFFVTSSDSGSLVVDMLTSGGHPDPPIWQRIFWALTEGAVAAALLVFGGLQALQSAAISAGLPLAIVLLLVAFGLVRALRAEAAGSG